MAVPRIFGMAFGLAGLGGTWVTAGQAGHVPVIVGRALMGLAAVVWLVSVGWYLRYVCGGRGRLRADLEDPVASPFASLALIAPMLLAAQGLAPYSLTAGRVLVDVFLVLTVLFGGWLTGQWICRPMELDQMHPGYYLPTVAGGLVACASAAKVGQTRLAEVMFGFGVICWFILGSMIGGRLFHRPRLPAPLLPTMAIEVAPAAIASVAYFALDQGRVDFIAAALAGYGLLMVIVQLRLIPLYARLRFSVGTWAFTFSWAVVATTTLHWIDAGKPAGHLVYTYLVLAAVTVLIGAIAARTVLALARGELLTPSSPASGANSS
ncbi:potassium-tellurite ethidium and proflavin transporter [Streptomyces bingchenggensis BCW-1]|uniref:Potassium-tellurite ethidium and proflavin transporter n=1 Tax=Streptomyces bingchenggensis (strain BCW-1) TaxID=749414 RepID=D7BVY4_STRBB|nr:MULTISPECIES: TDT family transporter [Streptomyces]ADI09713.1 potassium-tellurite ethidium and proflavin transporter [Streptomyces bingchenggensis BCW-1]